jgi:hypothetical protein
MDLQYVRRLIKLVNESQIAEIEIEEDILHDLTAGPTCSVSLSCSSGTRSIILVRAIRLLISTRNKHMDHDRKINLQLLLQ